MREQYDITGLCDFAFGRIGLYFIRTFKMFSGQEEFFIERVAMAFPKDSPWINHFDQEITKAVQGGLIARWKQVNISWVSSHAP